MIKKFKVQKDEQLFILAQMTWQSNHKRIIKSSEVKIVLQYSKTKYQYVNTHTHSMSSVWIISVCCSSQVVPVGGSNVAAATQNHVRRVIA